MTVRTRSHRATNDRAGVTGKPPFESVVARYGAMVLRVARAVLGTVDADDAWSETFLAALVAYPQLPADANVEAWLVTITHRKAIDIARSATRRAEPVPDTPDSAVSQAADARDLDLAAAVAALPDKQRHAVAYHYLAGMPYAQVARLLDSTESAARRAAADGIATLRRTYPADDRAAGCSDDPAGLGAKGDTRDHR